MNLQKLHERISRSGLDTGFLQLLKCTKGFLFSVLATQELLFSKSLKWVFEMYKKKKNVFVLTENFPYSKELLAKQKKSRTPWNVKREVIHWFF